MEPSIFITRMIPAENNPPKQPAPKPTMQTFEVAKVEKHLSHEEKYELELKKAEEVKLLSKPYEPGRVYTNDRGVDSPTGGAASPSELPGKEEESRKQVSEVKLCKDDSKTDAAQLFEDAMARALDPILTKEKEKCILKIESAVVAFQAAFRGFLQRRVYPRVVKRNKVFMQDAKVDPVTDRRTLRVSGAVKMTEEEEAARKAKRTAAREAKQKRIEAAIEAASAEFASLPKVTLGRVKGECAGGKTPVTVIKVAREYYKPEGMKLEVPSALTVSQAKEVLLKKGVSAAADRLARLVPPSGFLQSNETFLDKNITEVSFESRLLGGMPGGGSSSGAGSSSSASGANGCPDHIHLYLRAALHNQRPHVYSLAHNITDVPTLEDLAAAFSLLVSNTGPSIAPDIFSASVLSAVNQNKEEWAAFLNRRQQEDAVRRVRQRTEQVRPSRPKLLAEMTDAELDNQYERFKEQIESTHERLTREVNTLLPHGWGELLRDIMNAHADQTYPNSTNLKERRVKLVHTVCINGDVQRGKSTVEALIAVINWTIHNSPEVHDKVCTFLVTQLQAWASALRETFQIKTAAAELPHDDEDDDSNEDDGEDQFEEGGVDAEDLGSMPIVQKRKGVTAMEVKSALRQGGCAVAFRTHTQYQWYAKQVVEMNSELASYEKSLSMCVVLDEADKFFGDNCAHAKELYRMCGFDGNRQPNKPVMVIAVSATNPGPVYWLLRRQHTLVRNLQVMKVADIVSFKPAAPNTYSNQSESFLEPGVLMELPRRADEYVTPQVLDIYQDFLSRPCALMVDTLCKIVNTYVDHNMCEHVAVVVEELQRRGEQTPFVVLYGHGQETSFPGMMGLQFCLEEHLPEADRMMRKLETSMVEAADEERNLAHNLTASGDADGAHAARLRAAALEHEAGQLDENLADYDCLPVHYLSPLAWHIKAKALRLGHYQADKIKGMLADPPPSFGIDDMIGEQRFNFGENLQLVLLIIRKYIGAEVPIAVVAGAMLRRCMSVVAVDYFRPEISRERDGDNLAEAHYGQSYPLAVVSHMIVTGGANAPDGHQTAKRDNHTLTAFEFLHPDLVSTKKLMVPELAVAAEAFIAFNAMEELRKPLANRREMLDRISEATRGSERLRTIDNFRTGLATRVGDEAAARYDTLVTKVRSVSDLGADPDSMLALSCALAHHLKLPLPTRQLFQTSKTPMFQVKCGLPERDLGNIHANMVTIAENGTPPDFRHAIATRRGRGAGEPSSVVAFAANWMRDHGFVANANGGAPPNPPEAWTVMLGLRQRYPHLIDTPGYSQMSPTTAGGCGLGFAMKELCTRQIAGASKNRRPAPARPAMSSFPNSNGEARHFPARAVGTARQVNVYWLKNSAVVPALPAVQVLAAAALPAPAQ